MIMYDMKDILAFTYVARLGSFVRAAEALRISKSATSGRITELEKAINMTLFARTTREVNITTEGKEFFTYCLKLLDAAKDMDDYLQRRQDINGTLRIALPPYFSRYFIVPHLNRFLAKYPKLKLDIALAENPINIINEGYDLQIRIQRPTDEEGLEVSHIMSNHKVAVASPRYLEEYGTPTKPRDLLWHNCIRFGENTTWQFKHKISHEIVKLQDMTGNISCTNGEIIKELLLADTGIAVKSSRDIEDEIREGKLVLLLNDYEVMNETEFYAVYPINRHPSPKTQAFIKFFQNVLRRRDDDF